MGGMRFPHALATRTLRGLVGLPSRAKASNAGQPGTHMPSPLLTTVLRPGVAELRFFSSITTFAMPRESILDELPIECCFPMDDATAPHCRALADASASGLSR